MRCEKAAGRIAVLFGLAILFAGLPVNAQSEGALRQYFEGMTVVVKMDMPGTSDGVSVHPGRSMPVDFRKVALAMKQYGIGLHQGQSVMITKVHLKKKHIEFQLGGGGYGTFGDIMTNSMEHPTGGYYAGKSSREKNSLTASYPSPDPTGAFT